MPVLLPATALAIQLSQLASLLVPLPLLLTSATAAHELYSCPLIESFSCQLTVLLLLLPPCVLPLVVLLLPLLFVLCYGS
jgi:hypothetical protein